MSSLQCSPRAILNDILRLGNNITEFFKVQFGPIWLAAGSVNTRITLCFKNMLIDRLAGPRAMLCKFVFTLKSLGDLQKILMPGTSLVVQWLRIRLPMQGIWVRALVRGDPTCRRATKPVRHNY